MSKSKGLGDSIAKLTEAVGIKPCVSCEKRKNILNKLFPFKQVNALNRSQIKLIAKLDTLSDMELIKIYNDVFNTNLDIENFTDNIRNAVINDLKKLYENKSLD
jgi:hypothetical protein